MSNRKHNPIIGTIYNEYTVISKNIQIKDNRIYFEVKCKCNTVEFKSAKDLKSGRCKSCKSCASKKTAKEYPPPAPIFKGVGELGATYFSSLQNGAVKRKIEFDITLQYAWELLIEQNFKCNISGLPISLTKKTKNTNPDYANFNASLDRIDNNKGYIVGNVQWVHKDINKMKWKHEQEYFITLCKSVAQHTQFTKF